ncbi:MAG: peptidylprolyl isomerase [Holophagaceae bacterium]|nr:peptidylprolyl isomerase [Holophagaceae bacterium]
MIKTVFFSLFSLSLLAQNPTATTPAQPENKVIGKIGNVIYRESDFFEYLPLYYQPAQIEQMKRSPETIKQAQRSFLETMVLVSQAKKEGVDKWPEYQAKLKWVAGTLMMSEYVSKHAPTLERLATPTEEQIKAFYEANLDSYKSQDTASARHILISARTNENETDKLTEEEALAKVLKAKDELISGKDWQTVASEYSDDPGSKDNGGLYSDFDPSRMVPEFAEAVRSQEIGNVGEPIKSRFGYHIILVENRQLGKVPPLDEVRATVSQQLSERMRPEIWAKWVSSIKAEIGYVEGEEVANTQPPKMDAPIEAVGK